jgi:murein DD-endopeptidase MepM/ murein hydrolase activator NlpD
VPTIRVVTLSRQRRRATATAPAGRSLLAGRSVSAARSLLAGRSLLAALAVAAGSLLAGPAAAATTTTSSSTTTPALSGTSTTSTTAAPGTSTTTSTTSTSTTTPGPTTTVGGVNVPNSAGLGLEVPADEATLLALIDDVHGRLIALSIQINTLNAELTQNDVALRTATAALFKRQEDLSTAEHHVTVLQQEETAARNDMRDRAVAAYVHQPSYDLANMLLHLRDPTDLVDARSFYRTLVDVQRTAVENYDRLTKAAKVAVKKAAQARDAARRQQLAVTQKRQSLAAVKLTLESAQATSQQQATEQANLLAQVGSNAGKFKAELAALEAESSSIEQFLASSGVAATIPSVPTGSGYFAFPIPGAPITQPFGPSFDPFTGLAGFHPGIDFGASIGTPIHAAGDGVVVYAGLESGYGNYTCINHTNGIATCYAHQSVILVKVGDNVKRGQVIGLVGSTGYSTGPHLHFEVRINGQVTDPLPWLVGAQQPPSHQP